MTKKDYVKIAETLKNNRPMMRQAGEWWTAWEKLVINFADMLSQDNPRFDRERFLRACGYS